MKINMINNSLNPVNLCGGGTESPKFSKKGELYFPFYISNKGGGYKLAAPLKEVIL